MAIPDKWDTKGVLIVVCYLLLWVVPFLFLYFKVGD
jgi:hypothetical protein